MNTQAMMPCKLLGGLVVVLRSQILKVMGILQLFATGFKNRQ